MSVVVSLGRMMFRPLEIGLFEAGFERVWRHRWREPVYGFMDRAGSHTERPGCSIKLPPRPGRENHHGIVLDSTQGELTDAPMQK
jgi:hypothetical protein